MVCDSTWLAGCATTLEPLHDNRHGQNYIMGTAVVESSCL
jgi:hypothetical protein